MEKVDEELLKEAKDLTHATFSSVDDIVYELIEEVKYWKTKCKELENSPLEEVFYPWEEYGYDF